MTRRLRRGVACGLFIAAGLWALIIWAVMAAGHGG